MKITDISKILLAALPLIFSLSMVPASAWAIPGFAVDSSGEIVKTSYGCLHTARWKASMGECGKPPAPKKEVVKVKDSDGDGVMDPNDKCPGTPYGTRVDSNGCEIIETITIRGINFDFDRATLKDEARGVLDIAVSKLQNPNIKSVDVVGHTDSTGPEAYNQGLSERRASAVKAYLEGKGVSNVNASGAGESSPVADNSTRAGRAQNRRVEIDAKF